MVLRMDVSKSQDIDIPTKILKIDHEILVSKGVKRKLNIVNDKSLAG